jgi:hypothetical protein
MWETLTNIPTVSLFKPWLCCTELERKTFSHFRMGQHNSATTGLLLECLKTVPSPGFAKIMAWKLSHVGSEHRQQS